jgi:phosphopantothenoylcysteine synthetase/decarboxylase
MRFLVTAGNTREKIDSVRQWSNIFTGNTGLSIAKALAEIGEVDLLTSNRQHTTELSESQTTAHRITATGFTTHANLREILAERMRSTSYDAVFMTAAVSDYRPVRVFAVTSTESLGEGKEHWVVQDVQAGKVKSKHKLIAIVGEQTEKLVDLFRTEWGYKGLLVKFKLEVGISSEELIQTAQASRKSSGAEYMVANTLDMVEGPQAGAYLLSDHGSEWVPRGSLPQRLAQLAGPQ